MGAKTKIIVLHMKELIYTAIFIALGILLVILFSVMFFPKKDKGISENTKKYTPGIYTSSMTLNDISLEVEVTVDENHINAIRFSNLDDTVATMFPLVQPSLESITEQICETQSLENLSYPKDTPYTSQLIVETIQKALDKASR